MQSDATWLRRRRRREARALCSDERLVDYGILLYTVEQDPEGVEIRPDGPRVVRVREPEMFGGILDTRTYEWIDESANPVVWMVSEEQRALILHGGECPLQVVCEGAEGAGKTTGVLARWQILRALDNAGKNLEWGCTAPTQARLERVRQALAEAMPKEWYSYRQRDWLFTFALGHQLRLVSAHRQSEDEGSPVQGYDWAGAGGDECQDMLHIIEDVRARGRRAPGGRMPMMLTATVKGNPKYRSFRDQWQNTPNCGIRKLNGFTNPYVAPEYWEQRKHQLSPREYRRRVLAEDVGPELATYPAWDREYNLRPIPDIGAEDITTDILRPWGAFSLLGGHDPGKLVDVTLIAKAYRVQGWRRPAWWIVGEVNSDLTTTEEHVDNHLLPYLRTTWRCNDVDWRGKTPDTNRRILVRLDPYSDSGNDNRKPDKSVYTIFRKRNISVLPGATKVVGTESKPANVPKEAGIEMLNSLFCNAALERRLFVACDSKRQPVAPRFVNAIETSERDANGDAEKQKKDRKDVSHWPAAGRYMFWQLEKPSVAMEQAR